MVLRRHLHFCLRSRWHGGPQPGLPGTRGTHIPRRKRQEGKAFHDEILKVAQTKGSGWVDYWLPKPGQTEPSQKWSYVKAVKAEGGRRCWCRVLSRVTGARDVRFGSEADMCNAPTHVRFAPNSDRKSGPPQNVMSALGQKQTIALQRPRLLYPPEAAPSCHLSSDIKTARETYSRIPFHFEFIETLSGMSRSSPRSQE